MEKKILSIDLDIIMHPCIQQYNDDVEGDDNPIDLWIALENEYKLDDYNLLKYDSNIILEITKLLKYNKDKGKKIYYIQEHQEIVDILQKSPTYQNDQYHIYNIDFHHDLWYQEEDFDDILKHNEYTCANWAGYLFLKKKLKSFTWLKAPNSDDLEIKPYGSNIQINYLTLGDFYKLYDLNFDEIFFCLSPQWIPPKFHFFYDLIKLLLQEGE